MTSPTTNSSLTRGTLLLTSTLTVMSGATIAPSLPAMQAHFAEVEGVAYLVRLILTFPALFIVMGAPVAGTLTDLLGRKRLLITATVLYGFAGGSGFLFDSIFLILVSRAFLGLAVAGVMTTVTTLIADYYEGQVRAKMMGVQSAFMAFGGVIFLSVGGFLADLSWRSPFLIYLLAFPLLPFIFLFLFEPSATQEETVTSEISNKATLPRKTLSLIYGLAFLHMAIFYIIPVQLPFYLQKLTQATASESGIAIAFATLFSAFASMNYGRMKIRFSFTQILTIAFTLVGVGYGILGIVNRYELVILGLAIAGIGFGFIMPNWSVWLTTTVPGVLRGRALGGLTTFIFLGQFLSPLITQPISEQIGLGNTYLLSGGLLLCLALIFWQSKTS